MVVTVFVLLWLVLIVFIDSLSNTASDWELFPHYVSTTLSESDMKLYIQITYIHILNCIIGLDFFLKTALITLAPTPKGSQNLRVGSMFTPTPCLRVYPYSPSTFLRSHCFSSTKAASLCPSASHTLSNPSPGSINVLVYIYPKIIMISSCTCNWKDQCFTKPTLYAWYMCRERCTNKTTLYKKKKSSLLALFLM